MYFFKIKNIKYNKKKEKEEETRGKYTFTNINHLKIFILEKKTKKER